MLRLRDEAELELVMIAAGLLPRSVMNLVDHLVSRSSIPPPRPEYAGALFWLGIVICCGAEGSR